MIDRLFVRKQMQVLFSCGLTLFTTFVFVVAAFNQASAKSNSTDYSANIKNLTETTSTPDSQTARVMDFDGDGKSDYTVVRDMMGGYLVWYISLSSGGNIISQFGLTNDWLVPEDYDGDGRWDIAVWRQGDFNNPQGYFYILRSQTNSMQVIPWGLWGDTPEKTQDFDGDNIADPTVVRFNQGNNLVWYILQSQSGTTRIESFGLNSDGPIRGDFDGDNKADLAVRRCGSGTNTFWVKRSSDGALMVQPFGRCGGNSDLTVSGDFDGDNKTDFAVYRWSEGTWHWLRSIDGGYRVVRFGIPNSDIPAQADYDGDGKTDQAVWRDTGYNNPAYFHVNGSLSGYMVYQWGVYPDHVVPFELMTH